MFSVAFIFLVAYIFVSKKSYTAQTQHTLNIYNMNIANLCATVAILCHT